MDERIHEHVAGPRVERENMGRFRFARKNRDVADAAEIERDTAEFGVAIQEIVDVGNEGRALTTESDVRGTKVAHRGDSGAGGGDGWFADLVDRGGGAC